MLLLLLSRWRPLSTGGPSRPRSRAPADLETTRSNWIFGPLRRRPWRPVCCSSRNKAPQGAANAADFAWGALPGYPRGRPQLPLQLLGMLALLCSRLLWFCRLLWLRLLWFRRAQARLLFWLLPQLLLRWLHTNRLDLLDGTWSMNRLIPGSLGCQPLLAPS